MINRQLIIEALPVEIQERIQIKFGNHPPVIHPFPNSIETLFHLEYQPNAGDDVNKEYNIQRMNEPNHVINPNLEQNNNDFEEPAFNPTNLPDFNVMFWLIRESSTYSY